MTPEQFNAMAQLLRLRDSPSREAASLVLVQGIKAADAATATGLSPAGVWNVVNRVRAGMALAVIAAGR